jgi:hypothetical protein
VTLAVFVLVPVASTRAVMVSVSVTFRGILSTVQMPVAEL